MPLSHHLPTHIPTCATEFPTHPPTPHTPVPLHAQPPQRSPPAPPGLPLRPAAPYPARLRGLSGALVRKLATGMRARQNPASAGQAGTQASALALRGSVTDPTCPGLRMHTPSMAHITVPVSPSPAPPWRTVQCKMQIPFFYTHIIHDQPDIECSTDIGSRCRPGRGGNCGRFGPP